MVATFAAITGQPRPNCGPDSQNAWPVFVGQKIDKPIDEALLFGTAREHLAVRQGPWKLIPFRENDRGHGAAKQDKADGPAVQLYNLADDLSEGKNVALQHPNKVKELQAILAKLKEQ